MQCVGGWLCVFGEEEGDFSVFSRKTRVGGLSKGLTYAQGL